MYYLRYVYKRIKKHTWLIISNVMSFQTNEGHLNDLDHTQSLNAECGCIPKTVQDGVTVTTDH